MRDWSLTMQIYYSHNIVTLYVYILTRNTRVGSTVQIPSFKVTQMQAKYFGPINHYYFKGGILLKQPDIFYPRSFLSKLWSGFLSYKKGETLILKTFILNVPNLYILYKPKIIKRRISVAVPLSYIWVWPNSLLLCWGDCYPVHM